MNRYRTGYRAELKLVQLLKRRPEFHTVLRSAGSRSAFDVVAIGPSRVLLCQVKTSRSGLAAARRALRRLRVPRSVAKETRVYHRGTWEIVPVE